MWRFALLVLLVLALPAVAAAGTPHVLGVRQPAGALSIEGGKGVVVVKGNGGLLGRVAKGVVELVDLSPSDQWRPTVNGVTRNRRVVLKGGNVSFRILGGDYRVTVKGDGISISARGVGLATLLGVPGPTGETGIYAADLNADCQDAPDECEAIPLLATRVPFGAPDTAPSSQHQS